MAANTECDAIPLLLDRSAQHAERLQLQPEIEQHTVRAMYVGACQIALVAFDDLVVLAEATRQRIGLQIVRFGRQNFGRAGGRNGDT